jgi:translation elongation factor EF-Tu-like GTPase
VAFLRRNRADSEPDLPPDGLTMSVEDIFWIGASPSAKLTHAQRVAARKAPGTVLTGEVLGTGTLKPGDFMISEGSRFEIVRIEAFREHLERVQPPRNVGLVLGAQVDKELFRKGQALRFER